MIQCDRSLIEELIQLVEDYYGHDAIHELLLYGSRVKGKASANSDLDVMLLQWQIDKRIPDEEITAIAVKYNVPLSFSYVLKPIFLKDQAPFFQDVRKEAIHAVEVIYGSRNRIDNR